jgi:hypothetical protein
MERIPYHHYHAYACKDTASYFSLVTLFLQVYLAEGDEEKFKPEKAETMRTRSYFGSKHPKEHPNAVID